MIEDKDKSLIIRNYLLGKDDSPKLRWRKEHTYWKKTNEQGTR